MDTRSAFVSLQVLKFLPLITVETRFTDTRLIRTPRYYEQFSFSLVLIFSLKFNPLNMDTPSIGTLSMPPPPPTIVSILTGSDWHDSLRFADLLDLTVYVWPQKAQWNHVILQYISLACLFCRPCRSCDNTLKNCFFQISSYPCAYGRIIYNKTKGQVLMDLYWKKKKSIQA